MNKFIYCSVNGRISCQKLLHDAINSATGKPHDLGIIKEFMLTEEESKLSLRELAAKYPMEKE